MAASTTVNALTRIADRPKRIGWDPREPGALLAALIIVLVGGGLPWWGFTADTSQIPYKSSAGTDFGIWWAEEWELYIFAGAVHRDGNTFASWDFGRVRPEYADYSTMALAASVLWTTSLFAGAVAFRFRFRARSRMRGRPTIIEAAVSGALLVAITLAAVGFPASAGHTFAGAAGRLSWGPSLGWLLATVGGGLLAFATFIGWSTDRLLRGLCWKCFRPVDGPTCGYCDARQ